MGQQIYLNAGAIADLEAVRQHYIAILAHDFVSEMIRDFDYARLIQFTAQRLRAINEGMPPEEDR